MLSFRAKLKENNKVYYVMCARMLSFKEELKKIKTIDQVIFVGILFQCRIEENKNIDPIIFVRILACRWELKKTK